MGEGLFMLIEQIYTEIQHSGKGNPKNIWYHQIPCNGFDFIKFNCGCNNKNKKGNNPYKCCKVVFEIKENKAPQKIKK